MENLELESTLDGNISQNPEDVISTEMSIPKANIAYNMSLLGVESKTEFDELYLYGQKSFYKLRHTYPGLPGSHDFAKELVSQAMSLAILNFNAEAGTKFKSYFYTKIIGEITKYIQKSKSTQAYGAKMIQKGDVVVTYDQDGEIQGEHLDNHAEYQSLEDMLIEEEEYERRMAATRIAKSDLPMTLQNILYAALEYDKISDAASVMGYTTKEIKELRNNALSIMLKKVLRSNHLSEDEKISMRQEYKLI